jgi:hypothetical protein
MKIETIGRHFERRSWLPVPVLISTIGNCRSLMTRPGMKDKETGDRLIIDIERYQAQPDCQILVCYVYNPQRFIQNTRALKKGLEKTRRDQDQSHHLSPLREENPEGATERTT